ncbi:unnamed protein product [Closterium sp. Yama58-4]|nr:unnamed protein product [Closterium sp. Yama58-4]
MEVARTSMIHAVAPHFLWSFAVRYAAHQLNLWPRVSLPETSPTLHWTGEVGDASRFRVWGSRAFVRDTTADKLSSRAVPCPFLGFPPDAPGWQFYHPTSRRVFASQDVTFDESVPFYHLFPYRTAPLPPPPLFLAPGPAEGGPARGAAPGGTEPGGAEPWGAEPGGAEPGGAEPERAEPGGAEPERAEPGGAEPGGAEPERAEPRGAAPECVEPGGAEPAGAEPGGAESGGAGPRGGASSLREPLSPQQLREWLARRSRLRSGVAGAGGAGAGGFGAGTAYPGGACTGGTGVAGAGGAASRGGARSLAGAGGTGGTGATSPGGPTGASPPQSSRREPLSPQQLREWLPRRSRLMSGAVGAGGAGAGGSGAGAAGPGGARTGGTGGAGAGGAAETGGTGGTGAAGPGGARTGGTRAAGAGGSAGTGAAGAGGVAGSGAGGAGAGGAGAGGAGAGGTGAGGAGAGGTRAGGAGAGGIGAGGNGVGGTGAGGAGAGGTGAGGTGAGGAGTGGVGAGGTRAGGSVQQRPFFEPPPQLSELPPESVLRQVLSLPSSTALRPSSPLPAPSRYTEQPVSLTERREPASHPVSPVRAGRTARRVLRPCPPPVPGIHTMALRPSSAPQRVPLPSPPASSLPEIPDPESDRVRAASPNVIRLLATVVTDPSFESTAASALVAKLVDFAAVCRLDYAASLVAESKSVCPPSVGGECALGTDVFEDRQEDFESLAAAVPHLVAWLLAPEGDPDALDIPTLRSYAEAITGLYSSQWQTAMDADMASSKSTGTYVDEVPPPGANIVDGMWIFRVKRPPGSPPVFKARYVARCFCQRQGVDFFQTFSPTPKMTILRVLLHVAAQRDYELHSLDFSTAFLQGSLHEEIWLRRPPGFTGSFPLGTQWSLRRPVYGLRQAPREWHDTLRMTLAALGFAPSTADPSLFLRTDTSLPPFYILVYVDNLVFATADTEALALVKSKLQKRHTCTDLGELRNYLGLQITRDRARRTITLTQSHMVQQVLQRFGFQFSSPQSTPLSTGHSLSAPHSDESVESSGPYPELVGCLMYLMTCTRPDLAYPLSILARYVAPGRHRREHWEAAKRVLRYLCSTSGMGLVLGGRGDVVLIGHSDASWVDDLATQRSSQGYTFSLGSGFVSKRSTRSSFVLSSSCEAEIYATAMAAQELRWLTYLLTDLGERPRSPLVLYGDNKVALALC